MYIRAKARRTAIGAICVSLLSLVLGACAVNPVTGHRELMLVSESKEIEIGQKAAPSMMWAFDGEYHDPELEQYLGEIMQRLWKGSERPYIPMKFYIQNTSVPNAFALPGQVAITRGLLAELQSEAQFAAIMGHEMGHVMARHTAQRLTRAQLMQVGLVAGGSALSGSGGDLFTQAGALGGSLLLLKFGRGQELQADRLSVGYISRLGYDPHEVVAAHERLQVAVQKYIERTGEERSKESALGSILSTHPRHEVRREEILDMIDALPSYTVQDDGKYSERFLAMTAGIRKVNEDYAPYDRAKKLYSDEKYAEAEDALREAIAGNPDQAPFYNLLGTMRLKQKRYAEAERHFEMALSIDPGFQPAVFGRAAALLRQHMYSPALQGFQDSLALYPGHLGSVFGVGASQLGLGQYSEALPNLKAVASAVPSHPEVHGMLGICYENLGDLRAAYNEYALQLRVAPNNEYGNYARRRLNGVVPQQ